MFSTNDISVIIPAYNCEGSIERALESIFNQTDLPGEVIVVNDGSTDNTEKVLLQGRYADRIKYIACKNRGPGAARNVGILRSSKTWAAFLDADDIWTNRKKLLLQISLANSHRDAVLIDGFANVRWSHTDVLANEVKRGYAADKLIYRNCINATSSVLAKVNLIRKLGGFSESIRFGEDRLLWLRMALEGGIYTVDQVLVDKVNEEGNLTSFVDINYKHRLVLIHELIRINLHIREPISKVFFKNLEDFFWAAIRGKNLRLYRRIFSDAIAVTPARTIFSKFLMFAIYIEVYNIAYSTVSSLRKFHGESLTHSKK